MNCRNGKLEYWCRELPECEEFLRGFFTNNSGRDHVSLSTDYGIQLADFTNRYPTNDRYYQVLVQAFVEITDPPFH